MLSMIDLILFLIHNIIESQKLIIQIFFIQINCQSYTFVHCHKMYSNNCKKKHKFYITDKTNNVYIPCG